MTISNCDAIIFDLDGTLYDKKNIVFNTMKSHWKEFPLLHASNTLRKSLKGKDLGSTEEFFNAFYGQVSKASGKSVQTVEKWYMNKFYPRFIKTLKKKYEARPGLDDLLLEIDNRLALSVFSDYSHVAERMKALGIDTKPFAILAGSEEYGVLKPSARPLLDIASRLGIQPGRVIMVGDRMDTDGEAAKLAGMKFYHIKDREDWLSFTGDLQDYLKRRESNG